MNHFAPLSTTACIHMYIQPLVGETNLLSAYSSSQNRLVTYVGRRKRNSHMTVRNSLVSALLDDAEAKRQIWIYKNKISHRTLTRTLRRRSAHDDENFRCVRELIDVGLTIWPFFLNSFSRTATPTSCLSRTWAYRRSLPDTKGWPMRSRIYDLVNTCS